MISDHDNEVLAIKKQIAEIYAKDAEAIKNRCNCSWLLLVIIAPILVVLIAALAYIIGKIS